MLSIQNLSHSFGPLKVLKNITLEVEPGEILAIMGGSGSGKTTLLKIIAGLLEPAEGEVLLNGRKIDQAHAYSIGLVFQYAALFDSMNVRENILFGLKRQKKLTQQASDEMVNYLLNLVHLGEIQTKMPSELSGGMKKRVGLARALAMKPDVLLYDEPTSGLDPVIAYSIDKLIVDTRDQLGMTSIVVSHDVNGVLRVADRIAFLYEGELVFVGSSAEFMESRLEPVKVIIHRAKSTTIL